MLPTDPNPKHLDYLLTAYLFENISAAGKAEVEAHLAHCAECRDQLDCLRATLGIAESALDDGGKTYVFEEQRKKRVLEAAKTHAARLALDLRAGNVSKMELEARGGGGGVDGAGDGLCIHVIQREQVRIFRRCTTCLWYEMAENV